MAIADSSRTVIRMAAGTYTLATSLVINKDLVITGRNAIIDHDGTDGSTLQVGSGGHLALYFVTIMGADGVSGHGIEALASDATLYAVQTSIRNNQGRGIQWLDAQKLTVAQSRISDNSGGGILVRSSFAIVGNMIFRNGRDNSAVGGVFISGLQGSANRLEFNSLAKNQTQDLQGTAIHCDGAFTARNNIMSGNGTLTNLEQVGGTCTHAYSIARPGTVPAGAGNTAADPLFVNTTTGDLHIQGTSPAIGAADPSSDLSDVAAHDLDDQPRQSPADIGADEVP